MRSGRAEATGKDYARRPESYKGALSMKMDKALWVIRDRQRRLHDSIGTGIGIGLQMLAVSRTATLRCWGCASSTSFWRHG